MSLSFIASDGVGEKYRKISKKLFGNLVKKIITLDSKFYPHVFRNFFQEYSIEALLVVSCGKMKYNSLF